MPRATSSGVVVSRLVVSRVARRVARRDIASESTAPLAASSSTPVYGMCKNGLGRGPSPFGGFGDGPSSWEEMHIDPEQSSRGCGQPRRLKIRRIKPPSYSKESRCAPSGLKEDVTGYDTASTR